MKNLKKYTDYLINNKISEENAIEVLRKDTTLDQDEKNVIFLYCYPRALKDYELPSRVKNNLDKKDFLFLEAMRTEQYGRFMKHLMYSYLSDPSNIGVTDKPESSECCLCGKTHWTEEDKPYTSIKTTTTLCKDCLKNLFIAKSMILDLDPDFLRWERK